MEEKDLVAVRTEIFSRVRTILYERYGEYIPGSLIEDESGADGIAQFARRAESFRSDEDLLDLFDALRKIFEGSYGRCLFCHGEIDTERLLANPLAKFCAACEKMLNPEYTETKTDTHSNDFGG